MSLILPKTCSIGGSNTGLVGTIGVTLLDPDGTTHTARATADIYEIGGGCYGKEITFEDNWKGVILWDSGGGSPVYASEEYNVEGLTDAGVIADAVWDELLTGATHNIATSAGKRLRQLAALAIHDGTAQAGTTNTITLDTGASATDGIYNRNLCVIVGGTGAGQTREIVEYNGTTKVATLCRNWKVDPNATSEFQIAAKDHILCANHGYAQAGDTAAVTLEAAASSHDNIYRGMKVVISTGLGSDQARLITAYNGTTKVATVYPAWTVEPDSTSVYHVEFNAEKIVGEIDTTPLAALVDAIWDELQSGHIDSGSFGRYLDGPTVDRLLLLDTTIATLASQTSFTLTVGSADDDAYNNCTIVIEDASTATQKAIGIISNYVGASKTVTLLYDPAVFTMAATDKVYILAENALKSMVANRQLDVASDGSIHPTVFAIANQIWDELQSGHTDVGSFGYYLDQRVSEIAAAIGSGLLSCTWTQKDGQGNPMDNVQIWISTDEAGSNVVAGALYTNTAGEATFMLDAGTYYVWREKGGYNFTNPQTWTVS